MPIKIAITDDHLMIIKGLLSTLIDYTHIEVIGTYTTGEDLMKDLAIQQPDVLLLDLQLPDSMGNALAARIRDKYPLIRIIIFTALESTFHIKDIMQAGCMGYLLKSNTSPEQLVEAIEKVYAGETFIDPGTRDQMVSQMLKKKRAISTTDAKLTIREIEIIKLIAAQFNTQEIADKLFISFRTVENHRYNILQKLSVKNTAGLLMKIMEMGLMD